MNLLVQKFDLLFNSFLPFFVKLIAVDWWKITRTLIWVWPSTPNMGETSVVPDNFEKFDHRLQTIEEQNKQILVYIDKKTKKKNKVSLTSFIKLI